ncbi:MAG: hypothetical protein EXR93_12310 [Gemmatimonadetes bacterium]|nr:hypothetical protein [Gemmatimonadota bacterium]
MTSAPIGESPKSPFWLAFRVFDEPGQVFTELAQRPRGLVPVLIFAIAFAAIAIGAPTSVLQNAATQQFEAIEKSRPGVITPEIREKAISQAGGVRSRLNLLIFPVLIGLIFMALSAAILSLILNSLSSVEISLRDEWAIVTHANMVLCVGALVTWLGIALSGDMTFRVALGFLVSKDTSQFGHSLGQQITVFGAWYVYLLALGNQIKMKAKGIGTPLTIIGGFWIVLSVLFAWLSSFFGGMMG